MSEGWRAGIGRFKAILHLIRDPGGKYVFKYEYVNKLYGEGAIIAVANL